MINKQKIWFLTLFSLILILSVYYITMPSELLATSKTNSKVTTKNKDNKSTVSISSDDILSSLQVEKDEERASKAAEYNEILTNKDSSVEDKNNAYEGLKKIDDIKSNEEKLVKKIKNKLKLDSFIKIDGNNICVTLNKKDHNYSLANDIMRIVQEEFDEKMYVSVKFKS